MRTNNQQVKQYIHTHRRETNKARIDPLSNGPTIGQSIPSEVATFLSHTFLVLNCDNNDMK